MALCGTWPLACWATLLFLSCSHAVHVTRRGSQLFLDGEAFHFSGANIYWLGLDENVPPGTIAYPTKFRIRDALETAVGMGARVVRSHTLGISCGGPLSFEPSLDHFAAAALDRADYAVSIAEELGLKLVIPLTDNYHYYHGGKHCYTDWLGLPEADFYTNDTAIAAFQRYISALLTHNNIYTNRSYWESDSILAWETGNELLPPPTSNWTASIAAYIKTIDTKHLVLSGTFGVAPNELPCPEIDMHSDHFYPPDALRAEADIVLCAAFAKPFFAGEFGWTYNGTAEPAPFLEVMERNRGVASAGDCFWSLFPHLDTYGFEQHNDGFTLHYPGDTPFMRGRLVQLANHATTMSSNTSWSPSTPSVSPELHPLTPVDEQHFMNVSWRGSALAVFYEVVSNITFLNGSSATSTTAANDNDCPLKLVTPPLCETLCVTIIPRSNVTYGPNSSTICGTC